MLAATVACSAHRTRSMRNDPVEVRLDDTHRGGPVFFVADRRVGRNLEDVVRVLERHGARRVSFTTTGKIGATDACEFYARLSAAGLDVTEIWTPVAVPPGKVDFMEARTEFLQLCGDLKNGSRR
jgi:hypothetical protein